ncbi:TPA: hypothetical protein HA219_01505 [Candidatus Woesearchaeota archaeon]|nr:hypothetical protein [Candidatus Woesearchaeota archaeon]HIH39383.1 hypothetical protein [Candidatus Woesearchaeota archaeon]
MALPILLIAQVSASLTSLAGIIAMIMTFAATRGLSRDSFRSLIFKSGLFLIISVIGVTAMSAYHITAGMGLVMATELLENLWYFFMFLALIFSLYFSYTVVRFGKPFVRK